MAMTDEELLLQMKILTEKADSTSNPNMVFKSNKTLNKGLNPDYFSGSNTKIVNILNSLFETDVQTSDLSNRVANKINTILRDIDDTDGALAWEDLKEKMNKSTIIDGLNDLYDGKHAAKVLGVTEEDINKVLTVAQDSDGNLVVKAVEQIASGGQVEVNVDVAEIEYTNRYVSSITNVKQALDYAINAIANNDFEGGLGGGVQIGEITWDMIDGRPAYVADTLLLTDVHLELKEGQTVVSSVQLTSDKDIEDVLAIIDADDEDYTNLQ